MKTKIRLVSLLVFSTIAAHAAAPLDLPDLEKRLEHASLRGDLATIHVAIAELDAALAADAQSPTLLYFRGFAHYAAATASRAQNDNAAVIAELEKADEILGRVRGAAPWPAEAAALASSVCSQLIGVKGGAHAMTLGPKAGDLMEKARAGAPKSPRVLMIQGVSVFNTPPQWGGSPTEGQRLLEQAVTAFEQQDAAMPSPQWGRAEALVWLGIAKQKSGNLEAARAAWTRALEYEPEYGWVKYVLMPSLDGAKAPSSK